EEFAVLIERHPKLEELLGCRPPQLDAACVALAALLPSCQDEDWEDRQEFVTGLQRLANYSTVAVESLLAEADTTFERFAPVMRLPVPDRSLVKWYTNA